MVTMNTGEKHLETATPVAVNPKHQEMNSNDSTPKVSSDYEKCREERIKENLERMQKLGIYDLSLKLKSIKPISYRKNNKPLSTNQNKTPNRCISPLPSSVPTRRSSRLQNTPAVSYTEVVLSKKGKDSDDILMSENSRPEVYTEEHEKLLGEAKTEWTLFVDGYGKDGKKIYDQVRGKTCHQCRQKTLGLRTHCIRCNLVQGQFCGDCLYMRYGENVLEAMQNPDWICPVCRGICNCSLCRQAKGWAPTGILYRKISSLGYKSVAHYLIQTRRSDPNSEKDEKTVSAKRSLPFSREEVVPENSVAKDEKVVAEIESEDVITTNNGIEDDKSTELQPSDESLSNNIKLESDQELKEKDPELKSDEDVIATNNGIEDEKPTELHPSDESLSNNIKLESKDKDPEVKPDESKDNNKNKVDESEAHLEFTSPEYKVNKPDGSVKLSRKKRGTVALENSIAGRLRSRRKCT